MDDPTPYGGIWSPFDAESNAGGSAGNAAGFCVDYCSVDYDGQRYCGDEPITFQTFGSINCTGCYMHPPPPPPPPTCVELCQSQCEEYADGEDFSSNSACNCLSNCDTMSTGCLNQTSFETVFADACGGTPDTWQEPLCECESAGCYNGSHTNQCGCRCVLIW